MFFKSKKHPSITLAELEGFTDDPAAAQTFSRRFYLPAIIGFLLMLGGFGRIAFTLIKRETPLTQWEFTLIFTSITGGFGWLVGLWHYRLRATPISPRSKQPMEVYELAEGTAQDRLELVYLCRQSRTCFRHVYLEPG